MKMKWIMSSTLAGLLLVTAGSLALAEEKDAEDLSAYQWGYWDKMVSPAAGPLAPVGVTISSPLPPPPQPTPDPIPPEPIPVVPLPPIPAMPGMPAMPVGPVMPDMPAMSLPVMPPA